MGFRDNPRDIGWNYRAGAGVIARNIGGKVIYEALQPRVYRPQLEHLTPYTMLAGSAAGASQGKQDVWIDGVAYETEGGDPVENDPPYDSVRYLGPYLAYDNLVVTGPFISTDTNGDETEWSGSSIVYYRREMVFSNGGILRRIGPEEKITTSFLVLGIL